ncbi:hypothetical protein BH11BAC6_BH11BAC6_14040 [soil metagenome]
MQDVGGNIDELFRNAANNYMLKEGESNWEEISSQVQSFVTPVVFNKQNQKKKYAVTGLLLLLCFIAGNLFNYYTSRNIKIPIAASEYQNKKEDKIKSTDNTIGLEKTGLQKNKDSFKKEYKNTAAIARMNIKKAGINNTNYAVSITPVTNYLQFTPLTKYKKENSLVNKQLPGTVFNNSPETVSVIKESQLNKDSVNNNAANKLTVKNKRGIYYGLLAGIGFTTVKTQNFSKPGLDLGLVAGYHFSKRSSVEINLLYSNKFYYSDGKYFKMDKIAGTMPSGMKVMSVKSNSHILEIPVKFKYNLIQKNKNSIYAAAGVSSYILVNEKNDYVTYINGTAGTMKSTYKNTSAYFAGALNISAGYEHAIGKNNAVRFEPYITIPTKGIGIGSLPITTSGIHILFTTSPPDR